MHGDRLGSWLQWCVPEYVPVGRVLGFQRQSEAISMSPQPPWPWRSPVTWVHSDGPGTGLCQASWCCGWWKTGAHLLSCPKWRSFVSILCCQAGEEWGRQCKTLLPALFGVPVSFLIALQALCSLAWFFTLLRIFPQVKADASGTGWELHSAVSPLCCWHLSALILCCVYNSTSLPRVI